MSADSGWWEDLGVTRKASLAKLSRPRLFGVIQRERLFALLDENRGRLLVWLSGPPGAGKTTLVATYLESRELTSLWYQVDPGDADPASFFHYLTVAARTLGGARRFRRASAIRL